MFYNLFGCMHACILHVLSVCLTTDLNALTGMRKTLEIDKHCILPFCAFFLLYYIVLNHFTFCQRIKKIKWKGRYPLRGNIFEKLTKIDKEPFQVLFSQKNAKINSNWSLVKMVRFPENLGWHRNEAVLGNTCANGILVNTSTKCNWFLKGPQYWW